MYESFFGFKEKPFSIVPDPRFLYFSGKHKEALAHLIYGVKERKGFVVLSGEVGTGKTTLVRALLDRLDKSFRIAYLFNPKLTVTDFFKFVTHDFGLHVSGDSKTDYLIKLHDFFLESQLDNKTPTLIVDEAQNVETLLFEEIRMLTNLETDKQKLLQIVLVGQPELNAHLERPELSQLKQRVSMRYHLLPLDRQETAEYIQTRMRIAGAMRLDHFPERSIQKIYEHSGGVPRVINNICDNSLLTAYAMEKPIVSEEIIQDCAVDLGLDSVPENHIRKVTEGLRRHSFVSTAFGIIFIMLVVAGTILFDIESFFWRGRKDENRDVRLEKVQKSLTEEERIKPASQSEANAVTDSATAETGPLGEQRAKTVEGSRQAEISPMPAEPQSPQTRVAIAKQGDTIVQIILREFGRADPNMIEAVQKLNPGIENLYYIDDGRRIRLPEDGSDTVSVHGQRDQQKKEDSMTTAGGFVQAEKETSASPSAGTSGGTLNKVKKRPAVVSVSRDTEKPTQKTWETQGGRDKDPLVALRPARREEKKTASTGTSISEPIDAKAPQRAAKESLEQEARLFFVQYVKRYDRKDLDGLLDLFSLRAVQNQRHGFNVIRRMYSDFFDQSQEVSYHLEDMRIEIYKNAVEAKARYRIDQELKKNRGRKVWKGEVRWILVREYGNLRVLYLDYRQEGFPHSGKTESTGRKTDPLTMDSKR